jgi:hypothetical protein
VVSSLSSVRSDPAGAAGAAWSPLLFFAMAMAGADNNGKQGGC